MSIANIRGRAALVVALLLGVSQTEFAQQRSTTAQDVRPLEPGKPIEREMDSTEVHSYRIGLDLGQVARIVVAQRGIDVVVKVFGPEGEKISEIDSPTGTQGDENVLIEAKKAGSYRLEVHPFPGTTAKGRYEIKTAQVLSSEEYAAFLAAERAKYEAVKDWLKSNAIHLKTVEAGNGFEVMQPLKKLIGGAHLVALGEATHGTREFFQLKHRMLEFLVNEMGFTVFGIEATMPEAFDINEYETSEIVLECLPSSVVATNFNNLSESQGIY